MAIKEDSFFQRSSKWVDSKIRPFFYLLFFSSLGWCFYAVVLGYDANDKLLMPRIIVCSAIIAVTGWLWSGHTTRNLSRKTQAIILLLDLRSEAVLKLKAKIYAYMKEKAKGKNPKLPYPEADILLGIYETIALAVHRGTVDTETVCRSQRLVWHRTYLGLKDYIQQLQEEKGDIIYCHFVYYATKWADETHRYSDPLAKKDGDFFSG